MKVNQIVSEHKKGVRAKKYTTKAKGTVPVYGPDSKDAKLKPVKPTGTINEVDSVATAVKQNPDGSTVYKDATGAEKTAAAGEIKTGPDGKPTLAVAGITPGEQINITDKVAENPDDTGPVGGDPTDQFISQISSDERLDDQQGGTDQQLAALEKMLMQVQEPWEKKQIEWRITNQKNRNAPGIDMGNPVVTGGQLLPVVAPREWIKQNPNLSQKLPNDAMPPEMQTPGMLDRIKSLAGIK